MAISLWLSAMMWIGLFMWYYGHLSGVESHWGNYAEFCISFFCFTIWLLLLDIWPRWTDRNNYDESIFHVAAYISKAYSTNYVWHTHRHTFAKAWLSLMSQLDSGPKSSWLTHRVTRVVPILWVIWLESRVQLNHRQSCYAWTQSHGSHDPDQDMSGGWMEVHTF